MMMLRIGMEKFKVPEYAAIGADVFDMLLEEREWRGRRRLAFAEAEFEVLVCYDAINLPVADTPLGGFVKDLFIIGSYILGRRACCSPTIKKIKAGHG
jgi:hypothetical protein